MTPEYDDGNDGDGCPKCGGDDTEWEQCWQCHGEGGFHDCGEDCCCCADPEEITEPCGECGGAGGYLICHACIAKARTDGERQQHEQEATQ